MTSTRPAASSRPPVESHVHDVVDLATGAVVSTPGEAAPTPEARLTRLRRAGFPGDSPLFGTPSHRLGPRMPYQASPEGWLDAYEGDYGAGADQIWWRLPATFDNYKATCNATFRGVAAGARLFTVNVEVWPFPGRTGTIVVFVGQTQAEIPVSANTARTIDVAFTHDGSDSVTAMVVLRQGIYDFVVHAITLGSPGIVVTTQPPTA
jgi:ketosteroid isomerase-like protein